MKQNIYDNQVFFEQYTALRDSGVTANDFVEQPAIKSLLIAIEGKKVLDLGCGAGAFAKYCVEKGAAKVVAVDISKNMIEKARKENLHEKIDYLCSPIEELDLHNQTFDIIVSSLAIHYIEDYPKLIDKIKSLLIANGEFVFSTEHPLVTARKEVISNWVRDSEGNKLHWAVDHYKQEGKREGYWYVNGVVKYHRTVSTLINTLIEKGLTLERIIEPTSISGGIELRPKLIDEERRPSFIVIKAKKK
ncbi:class I SAM-dependent methyltransferase [Ureibacillus chungkukjangi]|uniref:class I SAM-dependent methyltransferase n=1 Tax=Ureibacillus chungkukjangi TaxID=1202712 RepID=UPI00203B3F4D|nr:class I SAM-dependent methyltransferase [Ureibacillus chungkukjangi]MCM3388863.1 class I SAM-dependent methyltransferase [Ureibacillus chungkukjangi]